MRFSMVFLPLMVACNGEDTGNERDTFTITAVIPASYDLHGGTDFSMAVVDDNGVADEATGVIGTDTSIDFTVPEGDGYELHFWIDSNIGAGTAGTCDFAATDNPDHQWSYAIGTVNADDDFAIPAHNTTFQDVCATFE